jgi:hypothetical protein
VRETKRTGVLVGSRDALRVTDGIAHSCMERMLHERVEGLVGWGGYMSCVDSVGGGTGDGVDYGLVAT